MVRFGREMSSLVDFFEKEEVDKEEDVTEGDEKEEEEDTTDQRT